VCILCTIATSGPIPENSLFPMCFFTPRSNFNAVSWSVVSLSFSRSLFFIKNIIFYDTILRILGLDLEMAFKNHYHEVLDTIGDMFTQIFRGLRDRYQVGSSLFTKTVLRIPDPTFFHPGSASKNLSILTQKIVFKLSEI
jgi:hypothetical protein